MPHKFNTSRRHKFAKKKYRVTTGAGIMKACEIVVI